MGEGERVGVRVRVHRLRRAHLAAPQVGLRALRAIGGVQTDPLHLLELAAL